MREHSHFQGILTVILGSVSIAIPFAGELFEGKPVILEPEKSTTIPWLSLPANLGITCDPLVGWSYLSQGETCEEQGRLAEGNSVLKVSSDPSPDSPQIESRRIHVYGLVLEGDAPVYCFYDSYRDLWFRLAVGEVDTESGIHLFEDEMNAGIHLVDLQSGERFLVDSEDWDLTSIDGSLSGI